MKSIILFLFVCAVSQAAPRYIGIGHTLSPHFNNNSLIIIDENPKERDFKAGEIVAFRARSGILASRLVRLTEKGWITKGDHNKENDPDILHPAFILGRMHLDISGARIDKDVAGSGLQRRYVLYPYNINDKGFSYIASKNNPDYNPPRHSVPDNTGIIPLFLILSLLFAAKRAKLFSS